MKLFKFKHKITPKCKLKAVGPWQTEENGRIWGAKGKFSEVSRPQSARRVRDADVGYTSAHLSLRSLCYPSTNQAKLKTMRLTVIIVAVACVLPLLASAQLSFYDGLDGERIGRNIANRLTRNTPRLGQSGRGWLPDISSRPSRDARRTASRTLRNTQRLARDAVREIEREREREEERRRQAEEEARRQAEEASNNDNDGGDSSSQPGPRVPVVDLLPPASQGVLRSVSSYFNGCAPKCRLAPHDRMRHTAPYQHSLARSLTLTQHTY